MPLNQCFCRAALPPTPSTPGKEEEEKILEVWGYGPVFVYIAPSTGTRKGRGMDLYIRICSHYPLHTGTRKGGGVGLFLFTLPPPHRYKEGWGYGPVFVHIAPSTRYKEEYGYGPAFVHTNPSTRYKEEYGHGPVFVHIAPSIPVQGRVGV